MTPIYKLLCVLFVAAQMILCRGQGLLPEHQVLQFIQSIVCAKWANGSSNMASAYLWFPENCKTIRGLLILCANVPEHRLVGHPTIREVCATNDLGIVWCVQSSMNFREGDGITFTARGVMLDQLAEPFTNAGVKLAKAPGSPTIEWFCGSVKSLGPGTFQIALDRLWPGSACYLAARQARTDKIYAYMQPCGVKIQKNNSGSAQKITFDPIPDVKFGTKSIRLSARFFVRAGPATVRGDQLEFTPIPPRSRLPMWSGWDRASQN